MKQALYAYPLTLLTYIFIRQELTTLYKIPTNNLKAKQSRPQP